MTTVGVNKPLYSMVSGDTYILTGFVVWKITWSINYLIDGHPIIHKTKITAVNFMQIWRTAPNVTVYNIEFVLRYIGYHLQRVRLKWTPGYNEQISLHEIH